MDKAENFAQRATGNEPREKEEHHVHEAREKEEYYVTYMRQWPGVTDT